MVSSVQKIQLNSKYEVLSSIFVLQEHDVIVIIEEEGQWSTVTRELVRVPERYIGKCHADPSNFFIFNNKLAEVLESIDNMAYAYIIDECERFTFINDNLVLQSELNWHTA